MALTRLQMDLPDHEVPVWATNANRTLDPDDTLADPVPVVKEDGWELSMRPPAKVMNWIQRYTTGWLQKVAYAPVLNWLANPSVGAADIDGLVYKPTTGTGIFERGKWTLSTGTAVYYGYTGVDWTAFVPVLSSAAQTGAATISTAYDAIFGTANGLEYNSTSTTLVEVLDAAIGGGFSGGARAMDSNGDRTIVFDNLGVMRIAATGVNGAWSSPSTPPSLGTGAGQPYSGKILYVGGSKWFAGRQEAAQDYLAVSEDDGDTWASITLPALGSDAMRTIAYDPGLERLVITGKTPIFVPAVYYSDDDGGSWTISTTADAGDFVDVYSCGGGVWVSTSVSAGESGIAVSTDNAETWVSAEIGDFFGGLTSDAPLYLMGDGRKLIVVCENGIIGRSLTY